MPELKTSPFAFASSHPFEDGHNKASTTESPRPSNPNIFGRAQSAPIGGICTPPAEVFLSNEQYRQVAQKILEEMEGPIEALQQQLADATEENKKLTKQLLVATQQNHSPFIGSTSRQSAQNTTNEVTPGLWKRMTGAIGARFKQLGKSVPTVMVYAMGACLGGFVALALFSPAGPIVAAGLVMAAVGATLWIALAAHKNDQPEAGSETEAKAEEAMAEAETETEIETNADQDTRSQQNGPALAPNLRRASSSL